MLPERQREELLQKLIEKIPVIIVMYSPDIKGIIVNKEFERVTGWTQAEAQSMNIMEACYPDPEYRQKVADFMEVLSGWMDIEMTMKIEFAQLRQIAQVCEFSFNLSVGNYQFDPYSGKQDHRI